MNDQILLQRVAVDGASKANTIRNIELTGPYFHNGGFKTLREVVAFYDRGGNSCKFNFDDLDPDIQGLGLDALTVNGNSAEEALVAFMIALTDDRVRYKQAPFDHPELRLNVLLSSGIFVLVEIFISAAVVGIAPKALSKESITLRLMLNW